MRIKSNEGFTLIELLLTVALLAIISIISFVSINAIINKNKDNECVATVNNIIIAAKEYYSDNRYNTQINSDTITLTVADLISKNYLNGEINDPYEKNTIDGSDIIVKITLNDDKTIKDVKVTENDGETEIFNGCKSSSNGVMSGIRITKKPTKSYQINYLLNGGKLGNQAPNTVSYESTVVISNPTKTINIILNDNSSSTANTEGAVFSNNSLTQNQEFTGWSSNSSLGLGNSAKSGSNGNPTTSWNGGKTKNEYFKYLRDNPGTVTMVANWEVTSIPLPEITKENHDCGWTTSKTSATIEYASGENYTPPANSSKTTINLYAFCEIGNYIITADANEGTIPATTGWTGTGSSATKTITYGENYGTLPTPTRTGYTFVGWYTALSGGTKIESTTQMTSGSNHTIYARWNALSYTISYTLNGGTNNSSNPANYTIESNNITLASPSKTVTVTGNANDTGANVGGATSKAQTFKGWTGSNGTTAQTSVTITKGSTGNKSYTANWTPVAMTLPTVIKTGYTCAWYSTSGQTGGTKVGDSGGTYTPPANSNAAVTVYARCTAVSYTISYTLNGGTNNSSNPANYTIESNNITLASPSKTVTVTGNANDTGANVGGATSKAQTFKGWTGSNGTTAQTSVTITKGSTGNKSYTANWTPVAMTLPTVTKTGYTCAWYSTSGQTGGTKVGDSGGTYTPPANSNAAVTVYARCTGNTYTATFYYSNGGTAASTTASCQVSNTAGTCEVTIPTTVTGSKGTYSNIYAGLSISTGNMTAAISSSSTKVTISANTLYYSLYSSAVNIYYPSSTTASGSTTAYRNQWFSSKTALATTVLSTTNTGTTDNYSYTSGVTGYSLAGIATTAATNTTTYTNIAELKNSVTTKAYIVLSKSITATFYYYNGSSQASITSASNQYIRCKSNGAEVSNSNNSIPTTVSTNRSPYTYKGVSNAINSSVTTTPNTGTTEYYAIYSQSFTASFAKGSGVSTIGATSKSCDSYYLTNGTTYSPTLCNITLPTITAASGYKNPKWYDNNNVIGMAGNGTSIASNVTYTAKAMKILNLGDYISMTPTLNTFTTDNAQTGYRAQTFNPQQLNLWRVININDDDTIEIISVGVGGEEENNFYPSITFASSVGYKNFVGYLNVLASKYENSDYTIGSRHFGYSNQTEYLESMLRSARCSTDENCAHDETKGDGDTGYISDFNLVKTALNTLLPGGDRTTRETNIEDTNAPIPVKITGTTVLEGNYFVASRYYKYTYDYLITFEARYISGIISDTTGLYTVPNSEDDRLISSILTRFYSGTFNNGFQVSSGLRPILILKSGLTYTGSGTISNPYVLSN